MQTEFEIVFTSINKEKIRDKLKNIWAKCVKKEILMKRVIYDNWEKSYARIRDEWDKITCTYKEILPWKLDINSVKELETEVWDFDIMKAIFFKMWLKQKAYQETKRENWEVNWEIEIMIDTWPWLKPFIEIEWKSEKIVKKYVELLWFNYNNWLFWAVDEIYLKELWVEKNILNNLSEITFENIPKK